MEVVIDGVRYVPKKEPEVILSTLKIKVEVDMDESVYKDISTIVVDEIKKQQRPGGLLNR